MYLNYLNQGEKHMHKDVEKILVSEEKNQYAKSIIEVENKNQHEIEIAL